MIVGLVSPSEAGLISPPSAAHNDQIICSHLRDTRRLGSLDDRVTVVRSQSGCQRGTCTSKVRSARSPIPSSELLQTDLAGLRHGLFAQQRFGSKGYRSAPCGRPSLGDTLGE